MQETQLKVWFSKTNSEVAHGKRLAVDSHC